MASPSYWLGVIADCNRKIDDEKNKIEQYDAIYQQAKSIAQMITDIIPEIQSIGRELEDIIINGEPIDKGGLKSYANELEGFGENFLTLSDEAFRMKGECIIRRDAQVRRRENAHACYISAVAAMEAELEE